MKKIYIIPDVNNILESLSLAERYDAGFEYNDFFNPAVLDSPERVDSLIEFYKALPRERNMDTLHGVFLDVTLHSSDSQIRRIADMRIRQSMEIAQRLGVHAVIFHTNTIPNFKNDFYVKQWLDSNEAYWRTLSSEYPKLQIYMENMFDMDPDALVALAERMDDVENFSVCFDFAHACVFGDGSAEWIRRLAPYIGHIHINDNDRVCDLHETIGEGILDFALFQREIMACPNEPGVLVEMSGVQKQRQSIEYLIKHKIYPYDGGEINHVK